MNRDQFLTLSLTDLTFKELVALFRRRWGVVLSMVLIALAVGLGISAMVPRTWRATSVVLVEGKTQSNSNLASDIVSSLAQSSVDYDVLTQIQIMNSFDTFYKALLRIGYPMKGQLTDEDVQKMPKLSIQQIQVTNTVQVSVEYSDDKMAVSLAQAIPQVYKEEALKIRQSQVERSIEFIGARLGEERKNLNTNLTELSDYKTQNNVSDVRTESDLRTGLVAEAQRRHAEAVGELKAAEAGKIAAEAQYNELPAMIPNPVTVTPVDALSRAAEILDGLRTQRDSLLVSNLPDSERILRVDAQIKGQNAYLTKLKEGKQVDATSTVRNPLKDELQRTYIFANAGYKGAVAKVEALASDIEARKTDVKNFAPIMAKMQERETKLAEIASSITRLSQVQTEIGLRNSALQSPIRNITGTTPAQFVRPILALNLALAGIVGLFLGCLLALVRDVSLDKVNTSGEASMVSEKEILGRIPLRASSRDPLIADPQKARAFEAYRILRTSVLLAGADKKAFLVTSTVPKEGKSTVAANLAVALALEGKRTILVDGNLRSPAVHKLFKLDRAKGVSEVLGGSISLTEGLKTTNVANLAVLTAGAEAANPTELVASAAMKDLIAKLSDQADIIIVDAPAAFGFADTQSLVTAVHDVLFVTHLETPSKSKMREAVGMVDFAGGKILGIILNKDKMAINRTRGA